MEPVTVAAGALITQIVKSGYEKWVDSQTESLDLTNEAREVLKQMQSDPTNNGIFAESSPLGLAGVKLLCIYGGVEEITTTWRVIAELESKGLVETIIENRRSDYDDKRINLTHFGWILNPETGQADKVG